MKILMIAPEPFFTPRGTPFSILHRLRAISDLGHEVDLVTYQLGDDVAFKGLAIHRIPKLPGVRKVRVGPSLVKLPLDTLLFLKAFMLFLRNKYDCVHTHEEGALMGALLHFFFRVPHLYDMHSSLPQQFINYNFFRIFPRLGLCIARAVERFIVRNADAVIAICPHLEQIAVEAGARGKVAMIENMTVIPPAQLRPSADGRRLKEELGVGDRIVALYTGTFEYNQGLPDLVRSIPLVVKDYAGIVFVLVGGEPAQVDAVRALAGGLGVRDFLILPGKRPLAAMAGYMAACDMLLSFRKIGTNTPLKLYSYLWAGKPTVATDLLVHTQVLNRDVAVLTEPTPEAFARGIVMLARDPALRARLGSNARKLAETRYTYPVYLKQTDNIYRFIREAVFRGIGLFVLGNLIDLISHAGADTCGELLTLL